MCDLFNSPIWVLSLRERSKRWRNKHQQGNSLLFFKYYQKILSSRPCIITSHIILLSHIFFINCISLSNANTEKPFIFKYCQVHVLPYTIDGFSSQIQTTLHPFYFSILSILITWHQGHFTLLLNYFVSLSNRNYFSTKIFIRKS